MKTKKLYQNKETGKFESRTPWYKSNIVIFSIIGVVILLGSATIKSKPVVSQTKAVAETVTIANEPVEKTISLEDFNALVKKEQDAIIETLGNCESGVWEKLGFDSPDAMIWFDPDMSGKGVRVASVGYLMFKVQTMQHYYKELHDDELTQLEAQQTAQDRPEAIEIARYVIFIANKGAQEWVNCFNKHGLQAKVDDLQEKIEWFEQMTH